MSASSRFVAIVVVTAASATGVLISAPTAAQALPTQVVQFSGDGIHWSDSLGRELFSGVILVPGGTATGAFYVRNGAVEPAILRITLADVSTNNIDYANGLSISSSTPGAPGASVPVSAAQPCYTLAQGLRLASGDSTRIDTTATLADLSGTAGQGGVVSFVLRISLSSTDAAAPLPNACPEAYGNIDTFADPTKGGSATRSVGRVTHSATTYHRTAQGWSPSTWRGGAAVTTPTRPVVPEQPSAPLVSTLVTNTGRFYQEYDVAFWLAMSVLGALIVILVRRRREEDQPDAADTIEQIGTQP